MQDRDRYRESDILALSEGRPPEQGELARDITVGTGEFTDFLSQLYLDFYIREGGSKIKFLTGRAGTGKTHFARGLLDEAGSRGYITVSFSAKDVWMHDFREVYLEILRQCDIGTVLDGVARAIAAELGYDPDSIRPGHTLMDALAESGNADALVRSEIRSALRANFTRNPLLDNSFASCCSLLVGGKLGHPMLEDASHELIMAHLHGDKTVKISQLRALGLSPARVTRYNARHLLRSLSEVVHMAGYNGIVIAIDDLDVLQRRSTGEVIRYTKTRREDAYESIRQLIDDIDSMRYVLFILGFDRELMDNEAYGFKSYQALWFRIQNEVISTRFNRFADIIDLDRLEDETFTPEVIVELSERLASVLSTAEHQLQPVTPEKAAELIDRSMYGGIGLPYLVNRTLMEGDEHHA